MNFHDIIQTIDDWVGGGLQGQHDDGDPTPDDKLLFYNTINNIPIKYKHGGILYRGISLPKSTNLNNLKISELISSWSKSLQIAQEHALKNPYTTLHIIFKKSIHSNHILINIEDFYKDLPSLTNIIPPNIKLRINHSTREQEIICKNISLSINNIYLIHHHNQWLSLPQLNG